MISYDISYSVYCWNIIRTADDESMFIWANYIVERRLYNNNNATAVFTGPCY